jgi:hypothetical protein
MEKGPNQRRILHGQIVRHLDKALALADQAELMLAGARIAHIIDDLRYAETKDPRSRSNIDSSHHWHRMSG